MPGDPDREHTPPPASDPTDATPRGAAQEKFANGSRSEKLTKSLTAKTKKTRYRDPLRTPDAARKGRQREPGTDGEKKVSKVFDSKGETD